MARGTINDLLAFLAVAREQSFTRAAGKLGLSQSALSQTIRSLETRMGVRLLIRTTRSVSPTQAGERLLQTVAPQLEEIEAELAAVGDLGGKPAGTIRITSTDYAANTILRPRLAGLLTSHPDLKIELHVDYALTDIVEQRYDLGVRWGDQIARDMSAVRVGPDTRSVIVASPAYLDQHQAPTSPQDLVNHNCITLRRASGGLYAWELSNGKHSLEVNVEGQTCFNGLYPMLTAALYGCGLAFVPEDLAAPHIKAGRLHHVLEEWSPTFPGLHAYCSSHKQPSRALQLVIDTLRQR